MIEKLVGAGIEIDRVRGTSMGSFIAAMFALGMDPDEIDAHCYETWVRKRPLTDYRVPRVSLIRGERVRNAPLSDLPGTIEELPRDFYEVTADLLSGEMVVHRRGPLYLAVGKEYVPPRPRPAITRGGAAARGRRRPQQTARRHHGRCR